MLELIGGLFLGKLLFGCSHPTKLLKLTKKQKEILRRRLSAMGPGSLCSPSGSISPQYGKGGKNYE
jgi:hypothetical protein